MMRPRSSRQISLSLSLSLSLFSLSLSLSTSARPARRAGHDDRPQLDDAATRARLEPVGIRVWPLREHIERLLDFATRSRWGKRPIAGVEAQPVCPPLGGL